MWSFLKRGDTLTKGLILSGVVIMSQFSPETDLGKQIVILMPNISNRCHHVSLQVFVNYSCITHTEKNKSFTLENIFTSLVILFCHRDQPENKILDLHKANRMSI